MAKVLEYSQATMTILESEDAARKRSALRAKYRGFMETRLGKPLEEWYGLLAAYDPHKARSHYQLTRYLQDEYEMDMADANVVVHYYLNPDKRDELG